MENFFKPVHSPCALDKIKPRKYDRHHHPHHQEDPQSHRNTMFGETDRNSDGSHGHRHHPQHGHCVYDSPRHDHHGHQTQQFHNSEEDEILYNHKTPVTLRRASSSSLSSSSTSSTSSWYTEASANGPLIPPSHAEQPQHSLSCSDIADMRRGFREHDSSKPIVFATIEHGKNGNVFSDLNTDSQKRAKPGFSPLDRGHSRSDEGPLQGNESDRGGEGSRIPHINYEPLYKTASLNQSLVFSEEDILLGVSRCPKRAVSSIQLPSKGILKNKEPHPDIRKAKSMEVLSPRVSKGQDVSGQKNQVKIEQARANFLQGKLQFSAFLDEITKQVMSPSDLQILGVSNDKATGKTPAPLQTRGLVKPQLPPKTYREGDDTGDDREKSRQEEAARSSPRKHSDRSNPDKLISYATKNHHGSPPPHHCTHSPSHHTHHGSNHKDRRLPPTLGFSPGDRYVSNGPHLTDGTSTSPELSQPELQRHHKQQRAESYSRHTQHFPVHQHTQQVHPGPAPGPGVGSENSSTKSDLSMSRDTASIATSHSSEETGQHHPQCLGHSKESRDAGCDVDHFRALQEENADLRQNLLLTVVCIESLELELQRTRDVLSRVKENYKSLLETHDGTKRANNLMGEHLHIESESLSSEREYLLNRVSQLSSELEDAHRTMAALENINVPCLIKELLEKHFSSHEAIQKFLMTPAPLGHSSTSPQADSQFHAPRMEEAAHDWMKSGARPQRVTAFIPFKQGNEECRSDKHESSHSPPFSVADLSTAIYKKMAAGYAARSQPLYPQSQQDPPFGTNHADTPPNLQQAYVCGDSLSGKGGEKVTLLEEDVVDVTSMSAQQVLDKFMRQLQPHREMVEEKVQQDGKEWVDVVEHTGKAAD